VNEYLENLMDLKHFAKVKVTSYQVNYSTPFKKDLMEGTILRPTIIKTLLASIMIRKWFIAPKIERL
jgi:hypothetical protein